MEHLLGGEWEIIPAGGVTGKAFFARHAGQELFLKRNSSPFLAMLSAEGIVPKLVWTKRLENGDVISAQHWMNGRELMPEEIQTARVARLMGKIHSSGPLLSMLQRLGKRPFYPSMMFTEVLAATNMIGTHPEVQRAVGLLKQNMPNVPEADFTVCHSDVNHHNWLLSDEDELFLIDWDGAMIADPAIDLGTLLFGYVDRAAWPFWFEQYGLEPTPSLIKRMKWYFAAEQLLLIAGSHEKSRFHEMNRHLAALHQVLQENEKLPGNGENK